MARFGGHPPLWRLVAAAALAARLFLTSSPAWAWERHDLLTRPVLPAEHWLDTYRNLLVQPATSDVGPYNPSYIPVYLDKLPGERESARQILETYVDEPGWGMDRGVQVSRWQAIDGGSQGYRQSYEYFLAGVVRVGAAPDRVAHFYRQALADMKAKQPYWAFRNLARSLYYLEELGDPLNTQPFLYPWLWRTRFDRRRLGILVTNFQLGYDRFVQVHLDREVHAGAGPLFQVLRKPPNMPFMDPQTAALALSEYSHGRASHLLVELQSFFPTQLQSTRKVLLPTPAEIRPARLPASYFQIMHSTTDSLRITAGAVKSVLELARRDFARIRMAQKGKP